MSVITAVRKNGTAVIAADTLVTAGSLKKVIYKPEEQGKILKCKDTYIGLTGWAALKNVFNSIVNRHESKLSFKDREDIFETSCFIHRILKEDYFLETKEDEDEQPVESSQVDCLIVNPRGIFELQRLRCVNEYETFYAIGSGDTLALGAMHALYDRIDDPVEIALAGIQAACCFDTDCGLPAIHFVVEMKS